MSGGEQWVFDMLDERAANAFLKAVADLVAAHPHPLGASMRLSVSLASGETVGSVPVDPTNLADLGFYATRRAAGPIVEPPPPGRHLRLVGEAS
ncbi:hypothetical protein [Streptomyces sp. NBC_01373]|uniref:hypothetical protein n=1 Tax=Streptomyces sp. NBC_01373 TaxID=2903843 RepID=UPI00224F3963|nr:hypothetical protein [Streptomyces sp. NBC_01373]MCX4697016.1 hypothetical protein [Streptomyces sp. NBC_01373]MCX4707059.1 hypothetical protein [Streptomyces sp. NBC_01373]